MFQSSERQRCPADTRIQNTVTSEGFAARDDRLCPEHVEFEAFI